MLLAAAKGIPVVAIGLEYQRSPVVFISKAESGIKEPKDFIGKKVGVKFGTDVGTVYQALMAKLEIERSKITEIPVKWDMTPFFTGQIDVLPGWVINQPLVAKRKGLNINILRAEDYGIKFSGNIYFTSKKTLKERPDLVMRFLAGLVDGWTYVFRHERESIDIVMKIGGNLTRDHQEEEYQAMLSLVASSNGRFCWMTQDGLQSTHDTLLQLGLLKKPLNLDEVYTMHPLKKVYE